MRMLNCLFPVVCFQLQLFSAFVRKNSTFFRLAGKPAVEEDKRQEHRATNSNKEIEKKNYMAELWLELL